MHFRLDSHCVQRIHLPALLRTAAVVVCLALVGSLGVSHAQTRVDEDALAQRLIELNENLRAAGEQEDHPQVESCMDAMIDVMGQLGYPADTVSERVHLRIQYSMKLNRLGSARQAALAWLKKHPRDFVARDMLATIYHRMALSDQAREALKAVYEADPNNAVKQRRYLEILMLTGARQEALGLCDDILGANSEHLRSLVQVCEAYLQFGKHDKAAEIVERIKKIDSSEPYLRYARGQVFQAERNFEEAARVYAGVPREHRDWYKAHLQLATCLFRLRRYEEAARVFVEVLTSNPYDRAANAKLEQVLRRLRKRNGGRLLWTIRTTRLENFELIDTESVSFRRRGDLANETRLQAIILGDMRRYRAAERLLIDACRSVPESIAAQENLAAHHIKTVQACRAEKIFRALLGKVHAADRDRITLSLVGALLRQGKTEEPIRFVGGTSPDTQLGRSLRALLGTYYLEIEGNEAKAVSYLTGISSASPEVTAALGRSLLGLGKAEEAWKVFGKLPGDFDDPVTDMTKVECLAQLGRSEQAQSLFDKTREQHPDLSILAVAQAQACLAFVTNATNREELERHAEQTRKALQTVRQLVVEANRLGWPKSIPVLLKLSEAYVELGESEEALKYAQLALEGDTQRTDIRRKVIQLMSQPEHTLERLHQIQVLQSMDPNAGDFAKETAQALAHLELTP